MEATQEACQSSKETHQNSQEIQVQTSQGNKEVQTCMGSSKRLCTYSCAVYAKKFDLLNTKDGNNLRGMPEQQKDSSELSRSPSTDKPRQQRGMGSSKRLCTYSCAVYAKKFDLLNTKDGNNLRGMPEQQKDS